MYRQVLWEARMLWAFFLPEHGMLKHSTLHKHTCLPGVRAWAEVGHLESQQQPKNPKRGEARETPPEEGLWLQEEARSFFSSSTLTYLQQTTKFIQYFVFEMGFSLCHSNWLCTSGLKQSSCLSLLSSSAPGCAQLYILYASVGFILSMTPRGRNYYSPNLPDERTAELHVLSVPHSSKSSFFCAKVVAY